MSRESSANPNCSEPVPAVVKGMGSTAALAMIWLVFVPLAALSDQIYPSLLLTVLAALLGSLAFLGYFLYKPLNPFSDNLYAPKSFHRLTEGEIKALGYLNSRAGKALILKLAAASALAPAAGAICLMFGLAFKESLPRAGPPLANLLFAGAFSGLLALLSYLLLACRVVWKRWDWIQQHQPLPNAKVLAKYARGMEVEKWATSTARNLARDEAGAGGLAQIAGAAG